MHQFNGSGSEALQGHGDDPKVLFGASLSGAIHLHNPLDAATFRLATCSPLEFRPGSTVLMSRGTRALPVFMAHPLPLDPSRKYCFDVPRSVFMALFVFQQPCPGLPSATGPWEDERVAKRANKGGPAGDALCDKGDKSRSDSEALTTSIFDRRSQAKGT
uniref:WD domain, G-beta repeat-containing protein n=1 Tax=Steinernema glaseri TaxID=37863 RepID=A0A1I7YZ07_9BILA